MDAYVPNVAEAPVPIPFGDLTFSAIESTTNPHPITITNPVLMHEFPETPQGVISFQALTRIEEWLSHGFADHSDDAPPRALWLGITAQLLVAIHNSICRTHHPKTFPNIFAPSTLSPLENSDFQTLASTLSSLSSFIANCVDDPEEPAQYEICLRCLEECRIPISEDNLGTILLSCGQNIKAAHCTVINDKLRQLTDEMDTWVSTCRAAIKDAFINSVVNDTLPLFHEEHTNNPCLLEWASHMKTAIRQTALAYITNSAISEVIDPWAAEALEGAKAHALYENETFLTNYMRDQHALAEAKAISNANDFYTTTLSALKVEATERAEREVALFKLDLKIKAEECKEALHLDSIKFIKPSSTSSVNRTNCTKQCADPTARPLPHSHSVSRSWAPSPKSIPPSLPVHQSPSRTPRASPIVELPAACALTEPPTDVSIGPPENSQEAIMLEVSTSQLSAYTYPRAPSAQEIAGLPSTMVEPVVSQSSSDPATSAVLSILNDTLGSTLKQISSQLSVVSTCMDAMESRFL